MCQCECLFKARKTIYTASMYKFTINKFKELLMEAGFKDITVWTDPQKWIAVCLAKAINIAQ